MSVPKPFPCLDLDYENTAGDANPAIQLFGKRFFTDQTILEYLTEFLLVVNSNKKISSFEEEFGSAFPDWKYLQDWANSEIPSSFNELKYRAPIRLGLKLFAFLGASKLDTRHSSHKLQYKKILDKLSNAIHIEGLMEKKEVLKSLENLFLGFQGAGANRTWCAQIFLPLTSSLVASETIWKQSEAEKNEVQTWEEAVNYFSTNQKIYMARGGELLYLQICNALRKRGEEFTAFISDFDLSDTESNPRLLHNELQKNLPKITSQVPEALDSIALLIDRIDGFTAEHIESEKQYNNCAWCPEESWREGYLFAVEINRICQAAIDPVERINMLEMACAFQVLRSLCAQSIRYNTNSEVCYKQGGNLNYAWIVSSLQGEVRAIKHLSQRNLKVILRTIQQSLRHPEIYKNASKHPRKKIDALYNEADKRYGHKLFLSLAKKMGFVIPPGGPGARFVFNEKILRFFILSLLRPGERRTYSSFLSSLYKHYGIAIEGDQLSKAIRWTNLPVVRTSGFEEKDWLSEMLEASGFLIHLSDACSLVHNPF